MAYVRGLRGVRILKAISSPIRLNILNLLSDKKELSYTELMHSLKMDPNRDAGKFAYHLKSLLKAGLIEVDKDSKRYKLTGLGEMVIDVAWGIEKKAFKPEPMLVRTSRFALEGFDVNKIVDSLVEEAEMSIELAQRVAKEAERRLIKAKTKYLTAPLIREVVNAILIERGLEEYRHKLTRLGLPVRDVSAVLAKGVVEGRSVHDVAGKAVLEEYVLLNALPRDVADAHISGTIHVDGLSYLILKPNEVLHDLRFFIKRGLLSAGPLQPAYTPPKNFDSALSLTFNVLLHSAKEVGCTQTLDYFNVFLAPFMKGADPVDVKDGLRLFILNVSRHVDASLGLELAVPDLLTNRPAIGPSGEQVGVYGDFNYEAQTLTSLILEVLIEECARNPIFNPKVIVKVRREALKDGYAETALLEAHRLALNGVALYLANALSEGFEGSAFSASGCVLNVGPGGDWEVDAIRTGTLGSVTVNVPRIAYECGAHATKFYEILDERLSMATRALEVKYMRLKGCGVTLLPFLMQTADGDQYFRIETSARLINLVGLREAVEALRGASVLEDEGTLGFACDVVKHVQDFAAKGGWKRLLPATLPNFKASERLARLDIERYGIAGVRFAGTREKPHYSTISRVTLNGHEIPRRLLEVEAKLQELYIGGSLTVIELGESERQPSGLTSLTLKLIKDYGFKLITYDRSLTYCANCGKYWIGSDRLTGATPAVQ